MKAIITTTVFLTFIVAGANTFALAAQSEIVIPRSMVGDKGKYYLLESKKKGNIVRALHKRVGVDSVGYSTTEINCSTMLVRNLNYSEVSPTAIGGIKSKW